MANPILMLNPKIFISIKVPPIVERRIENTSKYVNNPLFSFNRYLIMRKIVVEIKV